MICSGIVASLQSVQCYGMSRIRELYDLQSQITLTKVLSCNWGFERESWNHFVDNNFSNVHVSPLLFSAASDFSVFSTVWFQWCKGTQLAIWNYKVDGLLANTMAHTAYVHETFLICSLPHLCVLFKKIFFIQLYFYDLLDSVVVYSVGIAHLF